MSDSNAAYWHQQWTEIQTRFLNLATATNEMERLYNSAAARIEALEAENERVRLDLDAARNSESAWIRQAERLLADNAKKEAALRRMADPNHWSRDGFWLDSSHPLDIARAALTGMSDHTFEIWQNGVMVAFVQSSDAEAAQREAMHYAMVYGQDGPVQIKGDEAGSLFAALTSVSPAPTS